MIDRFTKNFRAALPLIAEKSERKIVAQTGGFDFVPAHGFKISRGNAEQLLLPSQPGEQAGNTRTNLGHNLLPVGFYLATNYFKRHRQCGLECAVTDSRASQSCAQNRNVSHAVIWNSFNS